MYGMSKRNKSIIASYIYRKANYFQGLIDKNFHGFSNKNFHRKILRLWTTCEKLLPHAASKWRYDV